MSFFRPVLEDIIATLDSRRAAELRVWSAQHGSLFDLRIHSIYTCPYLAYFPAYLSSPFRNGSDSESEQEC